MASPMENAEREREGVRFASRDEQISPNTSREGKNEEEDEELQQLRTELKNNMQSARMQRHAFEPVSLPGSQPASRVGQQRQTRSCSEY